MICKNVSQLLKAISDCELDKPVYVHYEHKNGVCTVTIEQLRNIELEILNTLETN